MLIAVTENGWVKCVSCGGTGKASVSPQLLFMLSHELDRKDRGLFLQNNCLVCAGKGQHEIKKVVAWASVGLGSWLRHKITGWLPNEIRVQLAGRDGSENVGWRDHQGRRRSNRR